MFQRIVSWFARSTQPRAKPLAAVVEPLPVVSEPAAQIPLESTVHIEELADAKAIAGDLFRRKFGQEVPTFPRHFVAIVGGACAGYVHYTAWQGDYLCGGLCIDDRAYRTLSIEQRAWLSEHGSIAEIMMRAAHAALTDGATIWGYIGDKQAEAVGRRVGFENVAQPYLFAIWRKPISEEGKRRRIVEAEKLGAF